jgi:hypothetical protein
MKYEGCSESRRKNKSGTTPQSHDTEVDLRRCVAKMQRTILPLHKALPRNTQGSCLRGIHVAFVHGVVSELTFLNMSKTPSEETLTKTISPQKGGSCTSYALHTIFASRTLFSQEQNCRTCSAGGSNAGTIWPWVKSCRTDTGCSARMHQCRHLCIITS